MVFNLLFFKANDATIHMEEIFSLHTCFKMDPLLLVMSEMILKNQALSICTLPRLTDLVKRGSLKARKQTGGGTH
jgi:hypothetical protein